MSEKVFDIDSQASSFYKEAKEDYISLSHISGNAGDYFPEASAANDATSRIIRRLLALGLVAGSLTLDHGFAPWPEQEADAVMKRIKQECQASGHTRWAADTTWFNLPS